MKKLALAAVLIGIAAVPAAAQGRGDRGPRGVPPGHRPPPGECRVWHDGVPPGHQPPPTDCGTAQRRAAREGGRVIYGDDSRDVRRGGIGDIWRQGGGGDGGWGVEGDGRDRDVRRRRDDRRDRDDRDDEDVRRREDSRDRGSRPSTGRAIPRIPRILDLLRGGR